MVEYNSGDIVRVFYPYIPKVKNEKYLWSLERLKELVFFIY